MSLINCPECNAEISEHAVKCNKCSFPISKTQIQPEEKKPIYEAKKTNATPIIAVILLVIILAYLGYYLYHTNTVEYKQQQIMNGIR